MTHAKPTRKRDRARALPLVALTHERGHDLWGAIPSSAAVVSKTGRTGRGGRHDRARSGTQSEAYKHAADDGLQGSRLTALVSGSPAGPELR
jgi:hypothetical protein